MKIGDKVWRFDANARSYEKPKPGSVYGRLIWRAHWLELTVVGETPRSWVVGYTLASTSTHKIPKKGPHHGWALSVEELDGLCWLEDHRHRILDHLRTNGSPAVMRQVAAISGYKEV